MENEDELLTILTEKLGGSDINEATVSKLAKGVSLIETAVGRNCTIGACPVGIPVRDGLEAEIQLDKNEMDVVWDISKDLMKNGFQVDVFPKGIRIPDNFTMKLRLGSGFK